MKPKKKSNAFYSDLENAVKTVSGKNPLCDEIDLKNNIVRMRGERKLSGAELCRRSGGLDPRTLTAIEKGRIKNPSISTLQALARGLGISVSGLFRQIEVETDRFCYQGSKKGAYQIDLPEWGVKIVSFTPFVRDFFCGKFMVGAQKKFSGALLKHFSPIHVSILIGRFEITVENKVFSLREGDNLFFNGILNHSFYNPLHGESVFWMVTAPSFL